MYIDTHAHLNDPNFPFPIDEAIANAKRAGIEKIIVPGMNMPTSYQAIELASQFSATVYAAVGIHPHNVMQRGHKGVDESAINALRTLAKSENVIALGEIGIDYHHFDQKKTGQLQRRAFVQQLELAQELGLPVIVHGRQAYSEVQNLIRTYRVAGVIHSFEATLAVATKFLDINWYIGLTGLITYQSYQWLQDVVKHLPLDRLLIETDAPYLLPQELKKSTAKQRLNQPANIIHIAQKVAEIKGILLTEVAKATTQNAYALFNL